MVTLSGIKNAIFGAASNPRAEPESPEPPEQPMNNHVPLDGGGDRAPVVFMRGGVVFAKSRDVADYFEKEHRNVMQAIDNLIRQEPSLAPAKFSAGVYSLPQTGRQQHRCFDMNRDGFTLLAMGFTGEKALKWKLRYIEAFNAMEARQCAPVVNVRDPAQLSQIAIQLLEVNKELETRAGKAEGRVLALEHKVEEQAPKVQFHDDVASAVNAHPIGEVAKVLGTGRTRLFAFLRDERLLMRNNLPYQKYKDAGYFRVIEKARRDRRGESRIYTQTLVTGKGLIFIQRRLLGEQDGLTCRDD